MADSTVIFLILSIDEVAGMHETLMQPARSLFKLPGFLYFSWVIFIFPIVIFLLIKYLKFLRHLPTNTKRLILLAGAVYVTGAMGTEMVGAHIFTTLGNKANIPYLLQTTIEESFEMLGIVIFLYALLSYAATYVGEIQFVLDSGKRLMTAQQLEPSSKHHSDV